MEMLAWSTMGESAIVRLF